MDSAGEANILDLTDRCPNLRHLMLFGDKKPELNDGKTRGVHCTTST
jgi:hypothetical protein